MPPAFRFRAHERKGHRKLTIDESFQLTGQSEVIQGETPNNNVGPQDFTDNSLHIVVNATLPWSLAPARKTAQAGFDVKRADVKGFDFRGPKTAAFFFGANTLKKSAGQTPGIASITFWAAIDGKDLHFAFLNSTAHCLADSIRA